jgi:hypothetical protein
MHRHICENSSISLQEQLLPNATLTNIILQLFSFPQPQGSNGLLLFSSTSK